MPFIQIKRKLRNKCYEVFSIVDNHSWALTDSNRRPSACKADALNQLS